MAQEVKTMVEGGKATTGTPLGPALGPLGLNLGQIVKEINEKTRQGSGTKRLTMIGGGRDVTYSLKKDFANFPVEVVLVVAAVINSI